MDVACPATTGAEALPGLMPLVGARERRAVESDAERLESA
jgi:hypothetical protein